MHLLDLTLASPHHNIALDEALLDDAEATGQAPDLLRLWEPSQTMVVIGRASRFDAEVHVDRCQRDGIPVIRRCSGGAAIVTGPGCLMYAVVLSYERQPELRMIDQAHTFVLAKMRSAVSRLQSDVTAQGTSDLTVNRVKFSGNSLRCKRTHLLYHGTLLYDFPLDLIGRYLKTPPRQPDYRERRGHADFVCNLEASGQALRAATIAAWQATQTLADWPRDRTEFLVQQRYSQPDWNFRR